jgi:hypothetical protein
MINTSTDGGPGYQEDWSFENNGWGGCTDGLAFHVGVGGTDSFDYGWLIGNHWQLAAGQSGLHIYGDEGHGIINEQGLHVSGNTNTAGGGSKSNTILVDSGSSISSSYVDLAGEDTGGNGFYDVNGKTYSLTGSIHSRASSGLINGASIGSPMAVNMGKGMVNEIASSDTVDEVGPYGRSQLLSHIHQNSGQFWRFYGANGTSPEEWGTSAFKLLNCATSSTHPSAFDPAVLCKPALYWAPALYNQISSSAPVSALFAGAGWGEEGTGAVQNAVPKSIYGSPDIAAHIFGVVQPIVNTTANAREYEIGDLNNAKRLYEAMQNDNLHVINKSSTGTVTEGDAFTGACSYAAGSAVTFHIVNGRIVSCN